MDSMTQASTVPEHMPAKATLPRRGMGLLGMMLGIGLAMASLSSLNLGNSITGALFGSSGADLSLVGALEQYTVGPTENVQLSLDVRSGGPERAREFTITQDLKDARVTLAGVTASEQDATVVCRNANTAVICTLAVAEGLARNDLRTLLFTYALQAADATACGSTLTIPPLTVTSGAGTLADPDTENNATAPIMFQVECGEGQ